MKTTGNKLRMFSYFLALAVLTVGMSGCGKKDDAPPPPPPVVGPGQVPPGGQCAAAAMGGNNNIVASAIGKTMTAKAILGLTFCGDGAPNDTSYSGPVGAFGKLFIQGNPGGTRCPFPDGVYDMVTKANTTGQWYSSMIGNLELVAASGPVPLEIVVGPYNSARILAAQPAIPGPDGTTFPYALQGYVRVMSVSGQPCPLQYPVDFYMN
jgi:hypothetical protein